MSIIPPRPEKHGPAVTASGDNDGEGLKESGGAEKVGAISAGGRGEWGAGGQLLETE